MPFEIIYSQYNIRWHFRQNLPKNIQPKILDYCYVALDVWLFRQTLINSSLYLFQDRYLDFRFCQVLTRWSSSESNAKSASQNSLQFL